jgi:hypothetical protein
MKLLIQLFLTRGMMLQGRSRIMNAMTLSRDSAFATSLKVRWTFLALLKTSFMRLLHSNHDNSILDQSTKMKWWFCLAASLQLGKWIKELTCEELEYVIWQGSPTCALASCPQVDFGQAEFGSLCDSKRNEGSFVPQTMLWALGSRVKYDCSAI